jgi:transcription initiation factor IIF auxiliary subunit
VKVWLDAPADFLAQVEKVVFEGHPTSKNRFKEVNAPPFEDTFTCWEGGEFTIRAVITLKSGETLRRQRYLALRYESIQPEEEAERGPRD